MTVYDTRKRCVYCRQFDLPCNDAVHGNPLFPYLGGLENLAAPYVPGQNEPQVRPATPPPPARAAAGRARTLSTVALIVVMICALLVGVVAYLAVVGTSSTCTGPCIPVDYGTAPTAPPTLPPPPAR
jgi:hypothetical protein